MVNRQLSRTIRINDRDLEVFRHIARYDMGLPEALIKEPFFVGSTPVAVKNVLQRLRRAGYLASHTLYPGRKYYHLTRESSNLIAEHNASAKPLSPMPKARAFGMLSFCFQSEPPQERLSVAEFNQYFPGCYRTGEAMTYYLDTTAESPKLGHLQVDFGRKARWDYIAKKCFDDIEKRAKVAPFHDRIRAGEFVVTVVTATEDKQRDLLKLLASIKEEQVERFRKSGKVHICSKVDFRVVFVKELMYLLAPSSNPSAKPR